VEIGANTRLLAVIGDPVAHSLSPLMHNAAIRCLGLDAVYVGLQTPGAALAEVLTALAVVGAAGNVTVPHKEAVERLVARKTDLCARAGACNTYWTEGGVLVGDNTDVGGIREALQSLGANGGGRWLVLGTGGAARAALIAARDLRAELYVQSRDPERARAFADWGASRGVPVHVAHGPVAAEVAINATPLGLKETDPLPTEPGAVKELEVALDLVYGRGETRWVRAQRRAGVTARDGREMLVRQGAAAFTRFFPGQSAPVEVMRAAVERALRG
jgi:shikimate dehydrogenase